MLARFLRVSPAHSALLLALAGAFVWAACAAADPALRFLRVRAAPVRSEPSLKEGSARGRLAAGQDVEVLETKGDWVRIKAEVRPAPGTEGKPETREGWMHATQLGSHAPAFAAPVRPWLEDGGRVFPPATDVPAGRAAAHAQRRKLDLKPVLQSERSYPSAEELERFLQDGELGVYRPDWPSLEVGVEP
ncbi:MAG: SH3 domain-containing protein [Planctomycetes bacterium]|nr:SH3 domain-containing protein [Planctomycetota bacterium]